MRSIVPALTPEIEASFNGSSAQKAQAFPVKDYRTLVEQIAKLAFLNKDYLLFFRGQSQDYRKKGGASSFYPSIYRGDILSQEELQLRFSILRDAEKRLRNEFNNHEIEGKREVHRKQYIRWSILQHYEVCPTPLLDFTHSIPVACSFAQHEADNEFVYVFVFGMPYVTNRISVNSEHDIVNVRLLSISPPDALRPYFQDGYLAGTDDITDDYENKSELDFTNRLIAKFQIPNNSNFWGRGFSKVPDTLLYPRDDQIKTICDRIKASSKPTSGPTELGSFLQEWTQVEAQLMSYARDTKPNVQSLLKAIDALAHTGVIDRDTASRLHQLRMVRNRLVHSPKPTDIADFQKYYQDLLTLRRSLKLR